jgi:hypothetical protein
MMERFTPHARHWDECDNPVHDRHRIILKEIESRKMKAPLSRAAKSPPEEPPVPNEPTIQEEAFRLGIARQKERYHLDVLLNCGEEGFGEEYWRR